MGERGKKIATQCLMAMQCGFKKNMCNLPSYGTLRAKINSGTINDHLPLEIQYACRYWVHHLQESGFEIRDQDNAHTFLQEHFLHWLEVISILGFASDSIGFINSLQLLVQVRCQIDSNYIELTLINLLSQRQTQKYQHFFTMQTGLF
jgi:hypothetical protein